MMTRKIEINFSAIIIKTVPAIPKEFDELLEC